MQTYQRIAPGDHVPILQMIQTGPKGAFLRACLDCIAMAGILFCAVLTTLIIGL